MPSDSGITALCYLLLSRVSSLWQLYILYLLIGASGSTLGMAVISAIIGNWFHQLSGAASGIAFSFSGIASVFLSPFLSRVIETAGWRKAYFLSAGIVALAVLPALLLVHLHPGEMKLPPFGAGPSFSEAASAQKKTATRENCGGKLFSSPAVWCLCAVSTFAAFITGITSHMASYAASLGLTAATGALMISASMMGNTAAKLMMGLFCDLIGPKKSCSLMLSLTTSGLIFLSIARAEHTAFLLAAAFLVGTDFSICGVGLSLTSRQIFEAEKSQEAYSYITLCSSIGSAFAATVIGCSFDLLNTYIPAVLFCALLGAGSVVFVRLAFRIKGDKKSSKA